VRYGVVACGGCGGAWAAELRNASSRCPRCATSLDLRTARIHWRGDSPQEAQGAAAALSGGAKAAQAIALLATPAARALPRHDSRIDAAAAQGTGIRNKSDRADAVAKALVRLAGEAPHGELIQALERAGLDRDRAEAEVTRMLATDILMEPRAGAYRTVDG
jgi:hypothetical protein